MATLNTLFRVELTKRIDEELRRLADNLKSGTGIPDYATYKNYIGQIVALERVKNDYCDEVETILEKR